MNAILRVNVETLSDSLERAAQTMLALENGQKLDQYQGIGFSDVGAMLNVFTPKRWALIEFLRDEGAMSVNALSLKLKRNYKNVHTDVAALMTWGIIKKNENNLVFVPYDELVFDVKLPGKKAA